MPDNFEFRRTADALRRLNEAKQQKKAAPEPTNLGSAQQAPQAAQGNPGHEESATAETPSLDSSAESQRGDSSDEEPRNTTPVVAERGNYRWPHGRWPNDLPVIGDEQPSNDTGLISENAAAVANPIVDVWTRQRWLDLALKSPLNGNGHEKNGSAHVAPKRGGAGAGNRPYSPTIVGGDHGGASSTPAGRFVVFANAFGGACDVFVRKQLPTSLPGASENVTWVGPVEGELVWRDKLQ